MEKQFCVSLEGTSTHQIAVGHTIRIVDVPHVLMVPLHDVRFHGAVAVVTKIFFCCPSKLMQSNLLWSTPICHPFSVPVVLVHSHKACLFCWAILSHMNLFYVLTKSLKSLGDEKKLSINVLSPMPELCKSNV